MAYTSEQLKAFGLTQQPTSSTPTAPKAVGGGAGGGGGSSYAPAVAVTPGPSPTTPEPTAYDRAMEILNARASTPANTTATPETIAPQAELSLPESKPDTRTSGLLTMIKELQGQNALREAEFNQSRDDLKGSMERMNEFPERAGEIREEEGVNNFRRQVDEIDSLIASRSRALDRQIELLESQPISGAMATRQAQQMQREATRELADLSLIQNARAGRLETAQMIASERIELELLPLEQQLEFDKFFYEENRDFLTDSQKQAFEVRIAEEERAYAEERERVSQVTDIMLTVAELGASPTLVKQIANAETIADAIALATQSFGTEFLAAQGSGTTSGSTTSTSTGAIMSVNQIDQFRRNYGWTPPAGFSWNQLVQFMNDNPGLSAEEYASLANEAAGTVATQTVDLSTLDGLTATIGVARANGYTDEEIKEDIRAAYSAEQLYDFAEAAGETRWWRPSGRDINGFLNVLLRANA